MTEKNSTVATPEKPKKAPQPSFFPSADAAVKEAQGREKGPRRAFKCSHGGKDVFVVANNEGRAGGLAFEHFGGKVEELGKAPKAPKALGVDGIMNAVNSLPEDQRKAVLDQLKKLAGAK